MPECEGSASPIVVNGTGRRHPGRDGSQLEAGTGPHSSVVAGAKNIEPRPTSRSLRLWQHFFSAATGGAKCLEPRASSCRKADEFQVAREQPASRVQKAVELQQRVTAGVTPPQRVIQMEMESRWWLPHPASLWQHRQAASPSSFFRTPALVRVMRLVDHHRRSLRYHHVAQPSPGSLSVSAISCWHV